MTLIFAIESSCDETAAAVVRDGRVILSNVIASQIELHARYGGVYPEVASRAHVEAISSVVAQAWHESGVAPDQVDAIAVTRGPGLIGSLLVGVNYAKGLALALDKPLIGVNHLEGHVCALWLDGRDADAPEPVEFPAIVLIVSGGHTELLLMSGHGAYTRLGGTLDDAAGEAFDKVGRTLGLPFPGGPHIEKIAAKGNATAFDFPRGKSDDSFDFSFSGLKTAVLRAATVAPAQPKRAAGSVAPARDNRAVVLRSGISVADVAASFQRALVESLVSKTVRAAQVHGARMILLTGGVSANSALRDAMRRETALPVLFPPVSLCTDNAAMIAAAAHRRWLDGTRHDLDMDAVASWALTSAAYVGV